MTPPTNNFVQLMRGTVDLKLMELFSKLYARSTCHKLIRDYDAENSTIELFTEKNDVGSTALSLMELFLLIQ